MKCIEFSKSNNLNAELFSVLTSGFLGDFNFPKQTIIKYRKQTFLPLLSSIFLNIQTLKDF